MILEYEKDTFYLSCKFAQNYLLDPLDKRWSKARRKWIVYDARVNREILKTLPLSEVSNEAERRLNSEVDLTPNKEIKYIYKTEPLEFQPRATKKLLSLKCAALFSPVGSGKSKIVIDAIQSLWAVNEIGNILIVAEVSLIDNWINQINIHWAGEIPWHAITITGVESYSQGGLFDKISKIVTEETLMLVDESHNIKNMKAIRTDRIIKLGEKAKYKYIMTGTHVLNGKIDLFSQFLFLDIDIIGIKTYIGFRNRYCVMGGFKGKQIVGYTRTEELLERIKPYTFIISKEEALPFLPSQSFTTRKVQLNPEQKELITLLKTKLISKTVDGESNKVQNILTQMLRISQIAGGFDEDANPVGKTNNKLVELNKIINESPDEQMIIFCKFLPELHMLKNELPDCKTIYGEINPKERFNITEQFNKGEFKYLICQYQSGATGLDMYGARICVYYSYDYSLKYWLQSAGRMARPQQKRPMLYITLIAQGSVDQVMYNTLQAKEDMSKKITLALKTNSLEDLFNEG